ncbi:sulfotransferase family protein [Ascidiaceihabitans sp.]|nr:sulfotransferase family protein [Ascidiaceihabitans sp.]
MLVFSEQNLVFLAVPKTGATAIKMTLRPKADVIFAKQRKHTTALRFRTKISPLLRNAYDMNPKLFAIMRDPIDQIASGYRYRKNVDEAYPERSMVDIGFDEFVLAVIEDEPPAFAEIGSQFNFLTSNRRKLLVSHLFAYEKMELLHRFLSEHFCEEFVFKQKNVSEDADTTLSPDVGDTLHVSLNSHYTTG